MDSDLDWISHGELERLTGAHRTTVARWKLRARAGWLPAWLARLVNTLHRGHLDDINAAWRGWLINPHDGHLVTPEGVSVSQGQIRALPQLYELRRALELELEHLRASGQFVPFSPWRPCQPRRRPRTISTRNSAAAPTRNTTLE